ncbi:MAG TPA: glycosyltransferase family 87 protein [Nocardioides sp.]|nr:glycosyltransferase family 87 protein [Nocardioides sp.]
MSFSRDELRSAGRLGALIGGWVGATGLAVYAVLHYVDLGMIGGDAHAYWVAGRSSTPYLAPPGHADAFEYSPVFLQLVRPIARLPFPMFYGVWAAAELVAFAWMIRGVAWWWRVPVLLLCVPELCLANINAFLGLVLVLGFRRPEVWAFAALTKITPCGVGLVWMLVRRDPGAIARVIGTVLVLSAISYVAEPDLWRAWFTFLAHHGGGSSLDITVRLVVAAAAAAVLALLDLRWPLPVPFILATPVFGFSTNQCLAMVPPALALRRDPGPERKATEAEPHH